MTMVMDKKEKMSLLGIKNCSKCNIEKNVALFNKKQTKCKSCQLIYSTAWKRKNKEKVNKKSAEYKKNNKGLINSLNKKYKQRKATPSWANLERIKCYYQVAAMLNKHGVEQWHVDHIIPLQGENVCGLHVEHNLRVIPAKENLSKGNKF